MIAAIPWLEMGLILPGFLIGLTLHEAAHAWAAWKLGDGYARRTSPDNDDLVMSGRSHDAFLDAQLVPRRP